MDFNQENRPYLSKEDFNTWLQEHMECFPELREWLNERGDQKNFVLNIWKKAFRLLTLEELREATQKLVEGEARHPNRFECSHVPRVILSLCPPKVEPLHEVRQRLNRN